MLQMDLKPTLDRLHSPLKFHHLSQSATGWSASHSLNEMASNVFACLGAVAESLPSGSSQASQCSQHRMRAVIETADSAASTSGRPEGPESSHGASVVCASLGADGSAAFVGVFHSDGINGCSLAWEAASRLGEAVEEAAAKGAVDQQLLQLACAQVDQELGEQAAGSSLSGCAALFSQGDLTLCTLGRCSVVIGQASGATARIPKQTPFLPHQQGMVDSDAEASLIAPRPILTPMFHTRPLRQGDCFLILGTAGLSEAMSHSEATDFVSRWREQPGAVGSTAAALAQEVHERLVARNSQVAHVSLAVAHFGMQDPLASPVPAPKTPSGSPRRVESQAGTQHTLLSPSGRRVHFLEPVQGPGAPVIGAFPPRAFLSPFHNPTDRAYSDASTSTESDVQQQSLPDSSSLISSGSQLSQPNMSIPEEGTLPGSHSALKLPPPLLPPVRKAYPSGELPSEVASPIRRAALTRSTSQSSPKVTLAGRLQSQTSLPSNSTRQTGNPVLSPVLRQSSGSEFGSRSRLGNGEEGRMRGGMPRIASLPSRLGGTPTSTSPTSASGPSTPTSGGGTPTELGSTQSGEVFASRDSGNKFNPWGRPQSPVGSKGHGQTSALRMLKSSGSIGKAADSLSAPAQLDRPLLAAVSVPESSGPSLSESETDVSPATVIATTTIQLPALATRPPRCGPSNSLRRAASNGLQQLESPHVIPVCSPPPPRSSMEGRSHGSGRVHLADSAADVSSFLASVSVPSPDRRSKGVDSLADSAASLSARADCVSAADCGPALSAESMRTVDTDS